MCGVHCVVRYVTCVVLCAICSGCYIVYTEYCVVYFVVMCCALCYV